jgi:hypothetical protein
VAEVTGTPAAEYLAGLWLGTLSHDLIFRREDAYESWDDMLSCLGSRDKYVAPSWFWASRGHLKSALVMTGKNSDMRDEWREASAWTVPTGTNPFGQVSAGTVKMTTKTCPITTSMSVLRQQWGSWDIKAKGKPLTSVDFDLKYTAHEGFDVLAARGGFKLALVARSYHDLHLREYDLKEGRDTRDVFGLELYQA